VDLKFLPNDALDPIFAATVQATEEAVINAMVAARTMTGIENHKVIGLPHDKVREVLKKYNRLCNSAGTFEKDVLETTVAVISPVAAGRERPAVFLPGAAGRFPRHYARYGHRYDRAAPLSDQTVLIEKQRIAAVGPADSIELRERRGWWDGRGNFLIPGLPTCMCT
jgi:hypothetical protein